MIREKQFLTRIFRDFDGNLRLQEKFCQGISNLIGLEKNNTENYETLGVVFSQYAKVEAEFIKHWQVSNDYVLAIRAFGGIAIPYGNSESIPFTRSYFAGGANDNRGWRPYDLGSRI